MSCPVCNLPVPPGLKNCQICGSPVEQGTSRPLPSAGQPESCRFCGYPLGGKGRCEMCGSPAGPPPSRDAKIRCPLCGAELGNTLSCDWCGSMVGKEEEASLPGFQCPRCAHDISVEDEKCGNCGLTIWIDESEEIARLDQLRCPACGETFGEEAEKCERCGFLVWPESEEDRRSRAIETINQARLRVSGVHERFGSVPERAVTYLEAAQRVLGSGELEMAARRALIAADIAEADARQKSILLEARRRAEEKLRVAEESGGDVRRCRELLDLSRQASEKGDQKVAIRLALKCKILAENMESSLRRAPLGV